MGGAYCMSKHAVEAYTDALALELGPLGVQVSVIDPGNYRSEISASARQRLESQGYSPANSRFSKEMERLLAGPADRATEKDPAEVAEAFLHAISDATPKRRYLVVPNAREAEVTIRAALARVAQLNAEQPYTYDREALIRMLDEALAANAPR
jgi:NAD(P)-dependent dehydrogenase (short-subunit alcohol dehydrogenase family)